LRNGVASSENELRTALILLTDLSYQARSWSREINIIDLDLIPETGIEWEHAFGESTSGAEVRSLALIEKARLK
jgi:hypothetical protein